MQYEIYIYNVYSGFIYYSYEYICIIIKHIIFHNRFTLSVVELKLFVD